MRRLFLFCTAIIAAISSFAAITYELNGGVTNDDNWLNKGDMFTACMTDAVQATYEQDMKLYDLVGRLLDQKKHTRTATFNVHHAGLYLLQTNNGIKKIKIE